MKELESNYFSSKEAFRNWLVTNHDKSRGIWMIFYKTAQKNAMSELGFTGLNDLQDYPIGSWESKKSGKSWFRHLPGRGRFSFADFNFVDFQFNCNSRI